MQKFIELNSLGEINETVVYPSARISNRVPFGTGRAMQKLLGESPEWFTTSFEIFSLIRPLLQNVEMVRTFIQEEERPDAYVRLKEMINLDDGILPFLQSIDFILIAGKYLNIPVVRHPSNKGSSGISMDL